MPRYLVRRVDEVCRDSSESEKGQGGFRSTQVTMDEAFVVRYVQYGSGGGGQAEVAEVAFQLASTSR